MPAHPQEPRAGRTYETQVTGRSIVLTSMPLSHHGGAGGTPQLLPTLKKSIRQVLIAINLEGNTKSMLISHGIYVNGSPSSKLADFNRLALGGPKVKTF